MGSFHKYDMICNARYISSDILYSNGWKGICQSKKISKNNGMVILAKFIEKRTLKMIK